MVGAGVRTSDDNPRRARPISGVVMRFHHERDGDSVTTYTDKTTRSVSIFCNTAGEGIPRRRSQVSAQGEGSEPGELVVVRSREQIDRRLHLEASYRLPEGVGLQRIIPCRLPSAQRVRETALEPGEMGVMETKVHPS